MKGSQVMIERAADRNIPPRKVLAPPVRIDSAFAEDEDEEDEVPEVAQEPEAEVDTDEDGDDDADGQPDAGADKQSEDGDKSENGKKKRRRRGRRGGRAREDQPLSAVDGEPVDAVPGLGDQPSMAIGVRTDDVDGSDDLAPSPEAVMAEATEKAALSEVNGEVRDTGRSGGKPRRDRWGRSRER